MTDNSDNYLKVASLVYKKFNHGLIGNGFAGFDFNRHNGLTTFFITDCLAPINAFVKKIGNYELVFDSDCVIKKCVFNYTDYKEINNISAFDQVCITYNEHFEISNIAKRSEIDCTIVFDVSTDRTKLLSEPEEYLLIKLFLNWVMLQEQEIIPEFFIDGAYNFNTDEFQQRLQLVEMIIA